MCMEYVKSMFHKERHYSQGLHVKKKTGEFCGARLQSRSQLESTLQG